jgi:hypothetical protein
MFELRARRMRTAIVGICGRPDLPGACQYVRLAGQRRRRPRFRLPKLCEFVADRAEDPRYCERDEQRERQQSGETDPDTYQHVHPVVGIGSPSSFLKGIQRSRAARQLQESEPSEGSVLVSTAQA